MALAAVRGTDLSTSLNLALRYLPGLRPVVYAPAHYQPGGLTLSYLLTGAQPGPVRFAGHSSLSGSLNPEITRANAFRLDINALRALSVLAVLGYHFRMPGLAGGFVGVDVFLVITGYLMTGRVINDLLLGRFSVRDFSIMRMRRIYPALAVVAISTAVAGWFVTLPGEYLRHLRQACYALLFLSNFAFDADNGYFALPAQTKPLLHTWSLSVEWQFYIWMPLVVSFIWRLASRFKSKLSAVIIALQVAAVLSLAWCVWESSHDAMSSAFFSLRARAWEPLAGGLIAAAEIRRRLEGTLEAGWLETRTVAVAGWLLVAGCIVYPLPEMRWPGALTILPILGAAIIIGARQGTSSEGLLAANPIQRLGDWSYSIYLWHWPIWVFTLNWLSLRGYSVGTAEKTFMALASLALGVMSFRYVEQPFRMQMDIWTPRRMLQSSAAVFCLLLGFTTLAFLTTGFPSRLPKYLLPAEQARKSGTPRDECFRNSNSIKKASETYCSFGGEKADGKPSAILWGDSFANQYLEPISSAAVAAGIHGLIATQSACRAFIDDPERTSADQQPCREFNRSTLEFVINHTEPSIVVLGSNWSDAREVSALVDKLLSSGKTVILIMPLLNIGFDVPQRWFEDQLRAGREIDEWKMEISPDLTNSGLREEITRFLNKYRNDPRLITVDPQSVVCDSSYCYLVKNGQANFRDVTHISNVTAMQFKGLFEPAFGSAIHSTSGDRKEPD